MSKLVTKAYDKVRSFSSRKKQDLIVNIESSSVSVFVLKWLFTNRLSVILFILIVVLYGSYSSMENNWLRETNKSLLLENEKIAAKTVELEKKIKEWNNNIIKASSLNEKVASAASKLNAKDKKAKIIQQIGTLKSLRKR